MSAKNKPFIIFSAILFTFTFNQTVCAKSVYAISDCRDSKVQAYKVEGNQIEHDFTSDNLPDHGSGSVGLAIDPNSRTLFASYDGANKIELVSARTMLQIKGFNADKEMAGLVFDKAYSKLLAMQR